MVKILIAEDEYTTRLMVQVSLENWGYSVSSVADGQAAWQKLRKSEALDIAIVDWEMPEIDGVELCKRVKDLKRDKPVYVILLTGRDSQHDIVQGFDAGADDYMTKPFNDDELRARVKVAERLVTSQSALAQTVEELKDALNLVDALQSVSYVCRTCNKITDEQGNWRTLKECVDNDYDFRFSQTTCNHCKR